MAEKQPTNTKTRRVLNVLFACIAIIAAVATVLLSPFGKRLIGKGDEITTEVTRATTEATVAITLPVIETAAQTNADTTEKTEEPSISIPPSTDPIVDIYKNYSIFIDKRTFDFTESNGVTTLVAKNNKNVTLTVTPHKDKSYTELCVDVKNSYTQLPADQRLKIENLNTGFSSQANDLVTTIYCIDDGRGGSIEVKYQLPVGVTEYADDIKLSLSMLTIK